MVSCVLRLAIAGCIALAAQSHLNGQTSGDGAPEILLSFPEPPEGYAITKQWIRDGEKILGFRVLVVKEGSASNVIVTVETNFDRSALPARIVATKGYINGLAVGLKNSGFDLTDHKLPDVERETFAEPVQADMTFTGPEGATIHTRQFIFFTINGYCVQVLSSDAEELEALAKWARHIRPALSEATR